MLNSYGDLDLPKKKIPGKKKLMKYAGDGTEWYLQ